MTLLSMNSFNLPILLSTLSKRLCFIDSKPSLKLSRINKSDVKFIFYNPTNLTLIGAYLFKGLAINDIGGGTELFCIHLVLRKLHISKAQKNLVNPRLYVKADSTYNCRKIHIVVPN